MGSKDRFITDVRMLIDTIEGDPAKLRAYYGDIERLIARCMDGRRWRTSSTGRGW